MSDVDAELIALVRAAVPAGLRLERTKCACPDDVAYCRQTPGHLIGAGLTALAERLGEEALLESLQASRGARVEHGGKAWRIPTIRPRTHQGRCVYLGDDDTCSIHDVAPFGCAFFDAHMRPEVSDARAWWGIAAIVDDARYLALHAKLKGSGGEVEPIGECETR